jgi:hypothetical protein
VPRSTVQENNPSPQLTSDLPTVLAETNTLDDAIIVKGAKDKKCILDTYKECFG